MFFNSMNLDFKNGGHNFGSKFQKDFGSRILSQILGVIVILSFMVLHSFFFWEPFVFSFAMVVSSIST